MIPPEINKTISQASFCQDIYWIGWILLDFLAQVIYIQAYVMRLIAIFISPNIGQDLVMRYHPTSVLDKVVEQPVFCGA